MKVRLLAVGQKMPGWVEAGLKEYARRLPGHLAPEIVALPLGPRNRKSDARRAVTAERESIFKHLVADTAVVALDRTGNTWSTETLAGRLEEWLASGADLTLIIGGPDGLHGDVLARSGWRWSLGPMTLPHPLVRIIVIEQLYRAWTILQGHPYHR